MSMANQESEMLEFCEENGIVFEAYAAMRACPFSNKDVQNIAAKHGVEVSQVCLRWVLQKGAVFAVGLGANTTEMPAYSRENLQLYDFELTPAEMKTLDGTGKQIASCAQGY
jgi:diketogulonate reductase-like aldo/keto reductase